jgi:hypothetical protein
LALRKNAQYVVVLDLLPHKWWDFIRVGGRTLHPSLIAFWCKCVPHHHASGIGVHIHLSIAKCEIS